LPPENLRKAEGLFYIHSIENWDEIERGLRAVHAKKMLAQSRLLRVSDTPQERYAEPRLGVDVVSADADEFNKLFDAVKADNAMLRQATAFKKKASRLTDVADNYFVEAMRSHRAVEQIMNRYGADAITIQCLLLQHRKPCVSFAINNGSLIPCGCENDFNATLTLMLGRWLFERAGFQHNPEFDTSLNQYFGAHCTCALKLHGPDGPDHKYKVRSFFHQLPKTAAMDVQWMPGEPVALAKYNSEDNSIACWTGKVIESPTCPPVGGCTTRVLVDMDKVEDICDVYAGPHPILFCADGGMARRMKVFAKMYNIKFTGAC
jgi:L-fucose isomerase-like protein